MHGELQLAVAVAHSCSIVFRRLSDTPALDVSVVDAVDAVSMFAARHTSSIRTRFGRKFKYPDGLITRSSSS